MRHRDNFHNLGAFINSIVDAVRQAGDGKRPGASIPISPKHGVIDEHFRAVPDPTYYNCGGGHVVIGSISLIFPQPQKRARRENEIH